MFAPLRDIVELLPRQVWPDHAALSGIAAQLEVRTRSDKALRFVASASDANRGYETRIFETGEVSTRDANWHDLFNALVWLTFPSSKAALNERHYRDSLTRKTAQRGVLRDALTLFDESGVIVACSDPALADLLREFRWKELFWHRRAEVMASMRVLLFGHALYEKAFAPYPGMTGHAVVMMVDDAFIATPPSEGLNVLDHRVAAHLLRTDLGRRVFHPLPLLGVPGWAAENSNADYYDNTRQFRPGRMVQRRMRTD